MNKDFENYHSAQCWKKIAEEARKGKMVGFADRLIQAVVWADDKILAVEKRLEDCRHAIKLVQSNDARMRECLIDCADLLDLAQQTEAAMEARRVAHEKPKEMADVYVNAILYAANKIAELEDNLSRILERETETILNFRTIVDRLEKQNAELQQARRWIPVSERPIPINAIVLLSDGEFHWVDETHENWAGGDATHWQLIEGPGLELSLQEDTGQSSGHGEQDTTTNLEDEQRPADIEGPNAAPRPGATARGETVRVSRQNPGSPGDSDGGFSDD